MLYYGSLLAKNALIFLHGYNQSAQNAKKLLSETINPSVLENKSIVIFFPNKTWYKYTNEYRHDYNRESLYKVRKYLHIIFDKMSKEYNLLVAGYSQGATMAIDASSTYIKKIPVLSISGLPLNQPFVYPGELYNKKDTIIYYAHGKKDPCILLKEAELLYKPYKTHRIILNASHWGFWHHVKFRNFFINFVEKFRIV